MVSETHNHTREHERFGAGLPVSCSIVAHHRWPYYALYGAVVLLLIIPIWTVSILPLQDYGDHLARVFVMAHYRDVPVFQRHYDIMYVPLPNLAIDLIATPLLRWFDPYITGKIFLSLVALLFAAGVHYLARTVHMGESWIAVLAAFLFYNSLLYGGFVNYSFSLAMLFLAAGAWLHFDPRPTLGRALVATLLASGTYLVHIAGFACLCCLIGLSVLFRVLQSRRMGFQDLYRLFPLVPGLAAYASLGAGEEVVGKVWWPPLSEKIKSLWGPLNSYAIWVNVLMLVTLIAAAVLVLRYAAVRWTPQLLIVAAALALAFFVFPYGIGKGSHADERFLVPALVFGVSAVAVRMPGRWARIAYISVLLTFSIRVVDMAVHWHRADLVSLAQLHLLRLVPENSAVFPLVFLPNQYNARKISWQLVHLAGYTTIERHAISGSMLTFAGQQPVRRKTGLPFANYALSDTPAAKFPWPEIEASYDYIWAYNPSSAVTLFLDQHNDLVGRSGLGLLYKVRRQH